MGSKKISSFPQTQTDADGYGSRAAHLQKLTSEVPHQIHKHDQHCIYELSAVRQAEASVSSPQACTTLR